LLQRYDWLDSVVRFAGEVPLVELRRTLSSGGDVQRVAGLTTRAGDGGPAPLLDRLPTRLTPERLEQPTILGHGVAHMLATRGCQGRCSYCGPAALQSQQWREGRRAGLDVAQMQAAGVGSVSRRSPQDVCEELATLYHERGVRYFYFVDEHLLPHDERAALEYLAAWKDGLRRREVGPLGIGTMLRADRLTPKLVRAFADVGLVRAFVGIEFGSDAEALRYARKTSVAHALRLLRSFAEAQVATVSNVMLVHPDSTPTTLHQGIDFLAQIPAGVFEIVRMMAYHGTSLWQRLRDEGRLRGNPLRYSYTFDDAVVERFGQIFNRLRAEAFFDHSIAFRTHDTHLALALRRRLETSAELEPVARRLESVRSRVNELYVKSLRTALALAEAGAGALQATPLVQLARDATTAVTEDLQRCEHELLLDKPRGSARQFSPMRAATSAAFVLSIAGAASLPACSGKAVVDGSGAGGAASSSSGSSSGSSSSSSGTGGASTECTLEQADEQREQVRAIVRQAQPCFNGYVTFPNGTHDETVYLPGFFPGPAGAWAALCDTPGNAAAKAAMEQSVADALSGQMFPCLGTDIVSDYVEIEGGAGTEWSSMMSMIGQACPEVYDHFGSISIVLDVTGAVVDVTGAAVPVSVLQCVQTTLSGLTFPCLAGYEICPEFAIAE